MARADCGEAAIEVRFDSADGQPGDLGDLCEFKLLYKAEEEDAALAL